MYKTFKENLCQQRGFQDKTTQKISKWELYNVTRNPEEWITYIELLRGDLQKTDVHTDELEIMTHVLSNLQNNTEPPRKFYNLNYKIKTRTLV